VIAMPMPFKSQEERVPRRHPGSARPSAIAVVGALLVALVAAC
jgi:hypothetical protein